MTDLLAASERAKYERMWARPEYRVWSPGKDSAEEAIATFGASSVIDFGCGEGKALDQFLASGMEVIGIDLVSLREGVIEACLWDLPADLKPASWGFCADVMEHIPTDKVEAVLSNIAGKVRLGCYFRISTEPDGMGALIGERLHLTVRDAVWWGHRVREHFAQVVVIPCGGYCIVVARK
ncbi:bifunctional 2-polyprenyl-6-hydroxyphenol methylase/3-demethylubiquinol 3-O-methyltransferase UbiG [Rhizobium sp. NLR22b]|uniref:class I SAM-dependent methyltransferase n=1 Tax=Rhizobium sp. NLR22b TaxID=2731115 RepID=UPI001C84024D|nr:class I SAM-dependent methyltransferase [Rhizobium sp. NLR22b]MBX5238633.1 class I SAM-dependent methyltransferase [Rhizobium sp. NLR22b]